jgi:predicted permease
VIECLVLTLAAVPGAVVLAQMVVALTSSVPGLALPRATELEIGWHTMGFVAAAAIAFALGMSAIPLMLFRRGPDTTALRTGHETSGRLDSRVRSTLVSAQTGIAFVLVAAAALLAVSLQRLLSTPTGFDAGVVTMRISAPSARYTSREQTAQFFREFVEDLSAQPGITRAGFVSTLPLSGSAGSTLTVQGREHIPLGERPEVGWQWANPGYFDAMGIPLLHGRLFTDADLESRTHVTVINDTLARLHFAGENPIGKRVYFGGVPASGVPEWHEIVGVVGDVRHRTLEGEPDPRAYDLFGQHWGRTISLAVRTTGPAAAVPATVRAVLARHDSRLALFAVRSTTDLVDAAVATRRQLLWLAGVFGVAGLAVALLGIYGIVACLLADRQREIGVRIALGARATDVYRLIMTHGLKLIVSGIAAGLLAAFVLRTAIDAYLFGVEATNLPLLAAITVFMLIAALVPCVIVSRRATRLDPVRVLRSE